MPRNILQHLKQAKCHVLFSTAKALARASWLKAAARLGWMYDDCGLCLSIFLVLSCAFIFADGVGGRVIAAESAKIAPVFAAG
jgi:hypothetical protein